MQICTHTAKHDVVMNIAPLGGRHAALCSSGGTHTHTHTQPFLSSMSPCSLPPPRCFHPSRAHVPGTYFIAAFFFFLVRYQKLPAHHKLEPEGSCPYSNILVPALWCFRTSQVSANSENSQWQLKQVCRASFNTGCSRNLQLLTCQWRRWARGKEECCA